MKSTENTTYAVMGVAALLPGMQFMIEQMQAKLDDMRAMLAGLQTGERPRRGRPPGSAKAEGARSAWAGMTAEERSIEMKRRFAVRMAKQTGKMHPRDPNHPKHQEFAAKVRKAQKRAWANLTPAQRKARLARMLAGRGKKQEQAVNGAAA
jgi:hypothetical protein